jgi:hypothetical protein
MIKKTAPTTKRNVYKKNVNIWKNMNSVDVRGVRLQKRKMGSHNLPDFPPPRFTFSAFVVQL